MNELRVPAALVVDVIFKCLGDPESHLLDDIEDPDELIGAALEAAVVPHRQALASQCRRFFDDAHVVDDLGLQCDQTYPIHDSPSLMILLRNLDSGSHTTSTRRFMSSSSRAVSV